MSLKAASLFQHMNPQEFIDYLAKTYNLKPPQAILKASELLAVTKWLVYRWLNGEKNPHPGKLKHMQKIVECDALQKRVKELEEKLNQQ